jgi:hypothetical protein
MNTNAPLTRVIPFFGARKMARQLLAEVDKIKFERDTAEQKAEMRYICGIFGSPRFSSFSTQSFQSRRQFKSRRCQLRANNMALDASAKLALTAMRWRCTTIFVLVYLAGSGDTAVAQALDINNGAAARRPVATLRRPRSVAGQQARQKNLPPEAATGQLRRTQREQIWSDYGSGPQPAHAVESLVRSLRQLSTRHLRI